MFIPRGICILCDDFIWSDEPRVEKSVHALQHICCPCQQGGSIQAQKYRMRKLQMRRIKYTLQVNRFKQGALATIPESEEWGSANLS